MRGTCRENVVSAVTVCAASGPGLTLSYCCGVDAAFVGLQLQLVAVPTISFTDRFWHSIRENRVFSNRRVAIGTIQVDVRRAAKFLSDFFGRGSFTDRRLGRRKDRGVCSSGRRDTLFRASNEDSHQT